MHLDRVTSGSPGATGAPGGSHLISESIGGSDGCVRGELDLSFEALAKHKDGMGWKSLLGLSIIPETMENC